MNPNPNPLLRRLLGASLVLLPAFGADARPAVLATPYPAGSWDCPAPVPASGLRWHLDLADDAGTAEGVAIAPSGDTVLAGGLSGPGTDLDPLGPRASFAGALGGSDILLASYDTEGRLRWHHVLGGAGDDIGRAVTVGQDGSVALAGTFQRSAVLGSVLWLPLGFSSKGGTDAFVSRYDPQGTILWARRIGGVGEDAALDVAVGPDDAVYVCGHFSGTVSVDPSGTESTLVSRGSSDAFVARFESDGDLAWIRQVGGSSSEVGLGVAVTADRVLLCGYSRSTDLRSTPLTAGNRGGSDAYVAAFRPRDGAPLHLATHGGPLDDAAYDVAGGPDGEAYVAGSYRGSAAFGSLSARSGGDARGLGTSEAFLLRLDSASRPDWVASTRQRGDATDSTGRAEGFGVAVSPSGCHAYLCGRFVGSIDFDPGPGEAWRSEGISGYCPDDRGFVWALDREGRLAWTEVLGGEGSCSANAVAVRGLGRLAVAGMSDSRNSCTSTGRAHLFLRSK